MALAIMMRASCLCQRQSAYTLQTSQEACHSHPDNPTNLHTSGDSCSPGPARVYCQCPCILDCVASRVDTLPWSAEEDCSGLCLVMMSCALCGSQDQARASTVLPSTPRRYLQSSSNAVEYARTLAHHHTSIQLACDIDLQLKKLMQEMC